MGFSSLAEFGSFIYGAAADAGISDAAVSAGGYAVESGATAAAVGYGESKLMGGKRPIMPPSPLQGVQQQDESVQKAEQDAQRRQSIAGGINSTVGTPGGQGGQVLNPGNMSSHTLLGQ